MAVLTVRSSVERSGRARVKTANESLVLSLEEGAIEAQVTPVPNGEAFAVDVDDPSHKPLVRVAVQRDGRDAL